MIIKPKPHTCKNPTLANKGFLILQTYESMLKGVSFKIISLEFVLDYFSLTLRVIMSFHYDEI